MRSAEALSGVGLSSMINSPPRQMYMAVRAMSQARSRFCILKKNTKGTSAMNIYTQVNSSAAPSMSMPNWLRNRPGSVIRLVGLGCSYWPRLIAWKNPSTVRG